MNQIPIFYYHSIAPKKDANWYKSYLTFELVYFEDFIKYLKSAKFTFLHLDEYFALRKDPSSKRKKLICLTFDDGYLDNYVFVYPLLKKYNAKGTIFISPEYIQDEAVPRPTMEDVWSNNLLETDLKKSGFLNWGELLIMEQSGVIDIQSHTMTHTKFFSSDRITDFHNPHSNYLYPIANSFPEKKPYYITNTNFCKLLPYGTPFFEEKSALISKKITINAKFQEECVQILQNSDWDKYQFYQCLERITATYDHYKKNNTLIQTTETQKDFEARVR